MKRVTIKEMRKWIKGLEENRYRKVYYPDARRVAFFVNNSTLKETDMPDTMQKKYKLAEYKREKFLAKKYIDEKLNIKESQLRQLISKLIIEQMKVTYATKTKEKLR